MNFTGIGVETIPLKRIIEWPRRGRRSANLKADRRRFRFIRWHKRTRNQTQENDAKKKNRRTVPHGMNRVEETVDPVTLKMVQREDSLSIPRFVG